MTKRQQFITFSRLEPHAMRCIVVQGGTRTLDGFQQLSLKCLGLAVRVFPKGGTWRRHIEQLRPRYGAHEDADPGEPPTFSSSTLETAKQPSEVDLDTAQSEEGAKAATPELQFPVRPYDLPKKSTRNPRLPNGTEYGPGNPRRSTRQRK